MTTQESFKRRIRTRMEKTGERYGAARRALLERAAGRHGGRPWADDPGHTDAGITEATGRGWDEWCDLIDAWPGHRDGHGAVAAWLHGEHGVEGWWAQAVTVGWERITGRRVRHQRADGTFEVSRSRTVTVAVDALRAALVSDDDRADLFPGRPTELRSRPTAKALRIGFPEGVALISFAARAEGRTAVTIAHRGLPSAAAVEEWRAYWADWLTAIDDV